MLNFLQIIVSVIIASASFMYMELFPWGEVQSALILPLSVLAAAALFRLARGVPNLPMDELDIEKVKELVNAYQIVTRRLAWMLGVTFSSIIGLISINFAYDLIDLSSEFQRELIKILSAFVIFGVVLSFFRGFALIRGDLDYVKIQSKLIVENAQSRNMQDTNTKLSAAEEKKPHEPSSTYGRQI